MLELTTGGIVVGIATLLVVAAASKLVSPDGARAAVVELGVPEGLALAAVVSTAVAEWATAAGLVLFPRSRLVAAALIGLFVGFAALGAWALLRGKVVRCGCFGSVRATRLGRPQLYQLAGVSTLALVVQRAGPSWTSTDALEALFLVQVAAGAMLLAAGLPTAWHIRRDRISLGAGRIFQESVARANSSIEEA